jgi:hypothetical protein
LKIGLERRFASGGNGRISEETTTSRNGHFTPFISSIIDQKARKRIQALEEPTAQRDGEVAELSSTVSRLKTAVEAIGASGALPLPAVPPNPTTPAPAAPYVSAAKPLNASSSAAARGPRPLVPPAPQTLPPAPSAVALPAAPVGFASLIVADFPALFPEFHRKRCTLLWRGSRDGFSARDFHGRCDGHAPTLTLIQDTAGNIFGGFTPVEWDSSSGWKPDPSLESFLFTLKNPRNLPARKFALKAEERDKAIWCESSWGPHFVDIGVSDDHDANTASWSDLGDAYVNDTALDGETVLTGSECFKVKEIEVFEITD